MASKRVVIVAIDGSDHAYDALDCEYIHVVSQLKKTTFNFNIHFINYVFTINTSLCVNS